jgi:hypothetical protein
VLTWITPRDRTGVWLTSPPPLLHDRNVPVLPSIAEGDGSAPPRFRSATSSDWTRREDGTRPLAGVFCDAIAPIGRTRSGPCRVLVRGVAGARIDVEPLEAIDGTPIVDIKPVLLSVDDR